MTYQTIDLTIHDGIARLVLNRPESGNSFSPEFSDEFNSAASELATRRDVRAVLLSARGRYFSVGGDIGQFSRDLDAMPRTVLEGTSALHMGLARLLRMDAPLVAAVQGAAMGGALSIVANCDLVYCGQSARLGAAYSRIGFSCDLGASFGLASRIGLARARRFLLFGEVVDATQAASLGLVDFVVPDADLATTAEQTARQLAAGPTRAFGEVRRLVAQSLGRGIESQLEDEAQSIARVASGPDAREGITAFVQKREPVFVGI